MREGIDAASLAAVLPDAPRLVETRAMLRAGTCDVYGDPDAYVARSRIVPLGAVIGTPPGELLRGLLDGAPADFELLVQPDDVGHVRSALRGWRTRSATMHVRPLDAPALPSPRPGLDVRVANPPDAPSVHALPAGWRLWASISAAFATTWVNGHPVAICEAVATTETWWEVGVGTLDGHRRRGYARAAFLALTPAMSSRGLRVTWGALDDNDASLEMARSLGFVPAERLWLLTPSP